MIKTLKILVSSKKIRENIRVLGRIQCFNDIAMDEEMVAELANQHISYSLVDIILKEVFSQL